ncbi:hypothetical protein RHMOL_Rhmol10G0062500 [Rhododendron molle]|uniref:Uncharacterized protein n=1 Tax=Rhododendron molle TaxID=49168 RepID=A0ACC0M176_RHOML|nr:hypothetical protein RHMOL_Rhmol10G0062500 [Rhododendron molle]
MDMKALAEYLLRKLKKAVVIVQMNENGGGAREEEKERMGRRMGHLSTASTSTGARLRKPFGYISGNAPQTPPLKLSFSLFFSSSLSSAVDTIFFSLFFFSSSLSSTVVSGLLSFFLYVVVLV